MASSHEKPRSGTAIWNGVQKAEIQSAGDVRSERVAVDRRSDLINDTECWLYAAVDPETNNILHFWLFSTDTVSFAREFFTERLENCDVVDAVFIVDDADDLNGELHREARNDRDETHGFRDSI